MEEIQTEILNLLSLIIAVFVQLFVLFLFIYNTLKKRQLHAAILALLCVNFLMQLSYPVVYGFFHSFNLELKYRISAFDIFNIVLLHAVYTLIFLLVFLYKNNKAEMLIQSRLDKIPEFDNRHYIFVIIGIYVLIINFSVKGMVQTAAEIAGQVESSDRVVNIYLKTMFEWTGIVTAVLYIYSIPKFNFLKFLSILFCIGVISRQLAMGLRGGIFIFAMLIIFFSYLTKNKINFRLLIPLLLFLIPLFSFLGGDFREEIVNGNLLKADNFERILVIKDKLLEKKQGTINEKEENIFESLYKRLEASRNSVSLFKLYENNEGACFKPTISALRSFVPQSVTGIKNYPGSTTDNAFGTAMYIVREKTYGLTDMGPYLTSAHEFWEGGIVYLIVSSIILGIIWRKLSTWVIRRNYDSSSIIILLLFLDAHHGEMSIFAPLAFIIRLFWYQILPTLILLHLLYYFPNLLSKFKIGV